MAEPKAELQGTTHSYVARVWYRDAATWFNLVSFSAIVLQEASVVTVIPEKYRPMTNMFVVVVNLWIRFQSSTRPVALSQGQTREVKSIPPAPPDPESTRSQP
jgi:hypothetical protein